MVNLYKILEQKTNYINLDSYSREEYSEDILEINEEYNEDFVEEIINSLLLKELPNNILGLLNGKRDIRELNENIMIVSIRQSYRDENIDKVCYRKKISDGYSFISPSYFSIGMSIPIVYVDDEFKEMFMNQFRNRLSIYTNQNKEALSSFRIKENHDKANEIDYFYLYGSLKDYIKIYYTELQNYCYKLLKKDEDRIVEYDKEALNNACKVMRLK